jgi:putative PIG3 family NAD(P)H quinone oxidoreductase
VRAVEIRGSGEPDVLAVTERPDPEPGPGEVLIDVVSAGVNRPDLMQRQGLYPPPPGVTDIPGLEIAGRVSALGPDDERGAPASATGRRWAVGDEVCALVAGGGYAERCTAPGVQCLPIPAGVDLVAAGAIPETHFTVWTNLFERGALQPGESVLVHGGSGGIGTTAIQLAAARGSTVFATCGTPEKCQAAERLGAARAINYRAEDFLAVVNEVTGGRGVDVVLDIVGGSYTPRNIQCLARDGRLVQIGMMGGSMAEISLRTLLLRRLTITGSTLRIRAPDEKGAIAAALEREVWPLLAAGRVRPVIDSALPLAEAAEAHRRLESGRVVGKLVLVTA